MMRRRAAGATEGCGRRRRGSSCARSPPPRAPGTFGTACRHNDEVAVSARMRAMAYRLALSLLRAWWIVRRPCVRCILRRGDAVLLVRHSYGDRPWMFPGGRVRRNENPVATARREMHQELGVAGARWQVIGCLAARRGARLSAPFVGSAPQHLLYRGAGRHRNTAPTPRRTLRRSLVSSERTARGSLRHVDVAADAGWLRRRECP
jgi:8-oxo-dGTP pyrophosphatase MutT (NUDIX family)